MRRATIEGDDIFVVARHDADAAALAWDDSTVLRVDQQVDQQVDLLGEGRGPCGSSSAPSVPSTRRRRGR